MKELKKKYSSVIRFLERKMKNNNFAANVMELSRAIGLFLLLYFLFK